MRNGARRWLRLRVSLSMTAVVAFAGAWPPAVSGQDRGPLIASGRPCEFQVQPIHQAGAPVFLLAAGEIDAAHAGPELLAVLDNGTILRLDFGANGWTVQPLPISVEPGLIMNVRPTVNIGDVHPGFAGNEIVIETFSTVNVLVQTSPGQWQKQIAFDGEKFLGNTWGVRIGDIDPAQPGQELFYIFEGVLDFSSGHFAHLTGGRPPQWESHAVFGAEVGMDSAIGDTNPASPGNEIVVGTEMGPVYEITPQPGNPLKWPRRTLWNDFEDAPWTLRITDVLPNEQGNEIVYGSRYSDSILLSRETPQGHVMEVLFTGQATEAMSMWDIAVADFVPESPTLEIVGVDNLGMAYLVQHDGAAGGWSGQPLWQDQAGGGAGLYASVIADFLPDSPGPEIVVAGQSGAITLIARREPVPGDVTCDGTVDVDDLITVILNWGPCPAPPPPAPCPADVDKSGAVDVDDLIAVILNWG